MLIGIDVGGTHTDGVCIRDGRVEAMAKVPTDHDNLLATITEALCAILKDCRGAEIRTINLSTTLSTNSIVTGHTEKVGMFVIPGPGIDASAYALGSQYHILSGCVDHRGAISAKARVDQIKPMATRCREEGIRVYGVVGKFCTRNPEQETAIAEALSPQADFVTQGHRVSESLNFGRRISTVYYNAAVWRTFNAFADALEQSLKDLNLEADINIVKADGGTMPLKLAREIPVQSIFSGPAASVMGILSTSPVAEDALILDIGGTTTDMAVLLDGVPLLERDGISIGEHPTLVRALKVESIGIGGDSFISSRDGQLRVGPDRHGPCMAAGGPAPALMDAMNVLGHASFGDRERSAKGIKEVAMIQGLSARECAEQAVSLAMDILKKKVSAFLDAINARPVYTIQEILEDRIVRPASIQVIGGPAVAMVPLLEETFGLPVVAPRHAEVANAIGACLTRPTQSLVLTVDTSRGSFTVPGLGIHKTVKRTYTLEEAVHDATTMLRAELDRQGIPAEDGDIQVIQADAFNMVEGHYTIGRNIRVRCQMRPGVITTPGILNGGTMLTAQSSLGIIFFPAFDWAISATHPEREERLLYTQDQFREEGIFDIEGIREYRPLIAEEKDIMRPHFCFPNVKSVCTDSHFISAGGVIRAAQLVMEKERQRAFAVVRPPGHHAMRTVHGSRGFCNINIEAVMIEWIREHYGNLRVAVVDTDCHHGDGTQDIYWHDPDVLFISLHQDGRTIYPGTGFPSESGGPKALGRTINVPMPPRTSDEGYLMTVERIVMPILDHFKPDLIINSAGQDNHFSDPITNMNFTAQGYARLTQMLKPDIAVLEGGYAIKGALPYVNLGISLALAGVDFSAVQEPDLDREKIREQKSTIDYLSALCDQLPEVYFNPRPSEAVRESGYFVRRRSIYYDTDDITETQVERLKDCPHCPGLLIVESETSQTPKSLGLHVPVQGCDMCSQEAEERFAKSRQAGFAHAQLSDRVTKRYEYAR